MKKVIKDDRSVFIHQKNLCNLILTQFSKEIKYDYEIPCLTDILMLVNSTLSQWGNECGLKKEISEIIKECKYENNSILDIHLNNNCIFGHEWFEGEGDFFRYRKEEKAKANSEIYSDPKLADCKSGKIAGKKIINKKLKQETEEFIEVLNKNIEDFYYAY